MRKYSEIIDICEKFDDILYKLNGKEINNTVNKNDILRRIEIVNNVIIYNTKIISHTLLRLKLIQ